ncbi:MAG TPA: HAD-IA family hydrolase [Longimicrobiaceae bacterium]|nr:HAD-IA family hydrolase [Longimicrobiaceae bacterium]
MAAISHLFFDIGGVLGTNGWDRTQRARARRQFPLGREFERRHQEVVGEWEMGEVTMDEYLDSTIFFEDRPFTREEIKRFMFEQSQPDIASIEIARRIAAANQYTLFTLNNESAELNRHRIAAFGLADIFHAFVSSCWLGVSKPSRRIYTQALEIAQAAPEEVLLIDDREQNLAPARTLGMETILFESAGDLEERLREMGVAIGA